MTPLWKQLVDDLEECHRETYTNPSDGVEIARVDREEFADRDR